MLLFKKTDALSAFLKKNKQSGKTVGFVPTMGALHAGHVSLIEKSKAENDVTVCSIFVNPVQFNDPEDLKRYPRPIERDIELLLSASCDVLFFPPVEEIYPNGTENLIHFDLGEIEKILDGKFRPNHFQGVANVMKLLLNTVQPDRLYMGQKDFQQVMVVRKMMKQENTNCRLIPCEIIREPDGLAMSSRNVRLNESERKNSSVISQTLFFIQNNFDKFSVTAIKTEAEKMLSKIPDSKLDYLEIANAENLSAVTDWKDAKHIVALVAIKVGKVRLIDNVVIR